MNQSTRGNRLGGLWAITAAAAIAGYGVLTFFSVFALGSFSPISIAFRVSVAAASAILVGNKLVTRLKMDSLTVCFLVFMAVYAFRMYLDIDKLGTDLFTRQVYFLTGVSILPPLALRFANNERYHSYLVNLLLFLFGVSCLLGIRSVSDDNMGTGRLQANDYYNPIDLGHAGVSVILICLYRIMRTRQLWTKVPRLLIYGGGTLLGASVLAYSGSRGPLTAGAICIVVIVAVSFRWRSGSQGTASQRILVVAILVAVSLLGLSFASQNGAVVLDRATSLADTRTGDESRLPMYAEAFDIMLDNPIVGSTTIVSFGTYPHNSVLEAGMAMGVAGAVSILLFFGVVCARSVRLAAAGTDSGILGLLAIQQIVASQFSGAIWSDDATWALSLLVLGTALPFTPAGVQVFRVVRNNLAPMEIRGVVPAAGSEGRS